MKTLHELALVTKQLLEFKADKDGNPLDFPSQKSKMWHVEDDYSKDIFDEDGGDMDDQYKLNSFDTYDQAESFAKKRRDQVGAEYIVRHGKSPKDWRIISSHNHGGDFIHIDPKTL